MNNILQVLLSPLTKLAGGMSEQTRALTSMEAILWKWENGYNVAQNIEDQTVLLGDIKALLQEQNRHFGVGTKRKDEGKEKDKMILGDASKFKALKDTAGLAAMVIGVSIAIVGASLILSTINPMSPMQIVTALAIAGLLLLITPAFVKIGDAFFGSSLETKTDKDGASLSATSKGGFLGVAGALLGLLGMLSIVVMSSYLLQLMGQPSGMQILTALAISVLFIPLAYAYTLIARELAKGVGTQKVGMKGMSFSGTDTSGIWAMAGAGLLALVGMIGVVVLSSWLLMAVGQPSGMQLLIAIGVAIIMIPLAFALGKIMKTLAENKVKGDMEGVKMVGMALLVLVTGVVGLVAASWILQMVNTNLTAKHFIVAILVGISMIPVAFAMGMLLNSLTKAGIEPNMKGVGMILMAGLALAVMAGAIVGAAWLLLALPDPNEMLAKMPPFLWAVTVGLAMVAFAFSYALILNAMKGASIGEMLLAGAALVIMALAILGVAWMFTHLPDTWNGPDFMWSLKIGVALLVFAIPFVLISLIIKKFSVSTKDLLKALMVTVVLAVAIFLTAWIFTLLPSSYNSPPLEWTGQAALAIGAFGGVLAVLGKLMGGGAGIAAIAIAAAGAIIVAVAILAIAWIFNFLPDMGSIADNISNLIIVPINKLVDVLARIKNEIGVDNLIPLAIGIGAISMALLLLAGATAGLAAGGVMAALGEAAEDFIEGIGKFFGGDGESEGPLEVLERVIRNRQGIAEVAVALHAFGAAASSLLKAGPVVDVVNGILSPLGTSGSLAVLNLEFFVKSINKIDAQNLVTMADPVSKISNALHWLGDSNYNTIKAATNFIQVLNASAFDKQAAALERIAKAYKSIAESTQRINQVSMQRTTELVKALGYLSAKGGQGAVKELGDSLIKAIEELGNLLQEYLGAREEDDKKDKGNDNNNSLLSIGGGNVDVSSVVAAINDLKSRLTVQGVKVYNNEGERLHVGP